MLRNEHTACCPDLTVTTGWQRVGRISVTLNGFEHVTDIRTKAHRRQAETAA